MVIREGRNPGERKKGKTYNLCQINFFFGWWRV